MTQRHATLFAAALSLLPAAVAQPTKRYTTKFEVSITRRANVLQPPYQVMGELALDVASDGSFSCSISPLQGLPEAPASVILVGGQFQAGGPKSLPCSGQVSGRMIALTIDVDNTYKIYGTGALPADLAKLPPGPIPVAFGGTAITSVAGESGDWFIFCARVLLQNPITGKVYYDKNVCVNIPEVKVQINGR